MNRFTALVKAAFRRVMRNRAGLVLLISVPMLVAAWRLGVLAAQPRHLQEIAAELGSVGGFMATPVADHAATHVAFTQQTETGVGLFLAETATGMRRLLAELPERDYRIDHLQALGWSPDDKLFAYCFGSISLDKQGKPRWNSEIGLCDGGSGAAVATIPVPHGALDLAWMSNDSFAYTDGVPELYKVRQTADLKWTRPRAFKKPVKSAPAPKGPAAAAKAPPRPPMQWLAAVSPDFVLFQQAGALWGWNFDREEAGQIWASPSNTLVNFSMLPEGRGVFLHWTNRNGSSLARLSLSDRRVTELGRVGAGIAVKVLPVNEGEGFAWLAADRGQYSVWLKTNVKAEPVRLLARGLVERLSGSGNALYLVGSLTNEPPGIWEYGPGSETPRLAVRNPERPFRYARPANLELGEFTNSAGELVTYHLLTPPDRVRGKKYPLLLGQNPYSWRGPQDAAVSAGAYWLAVDRPSFHDERIRRWSEDVMGAYVEMAKRPDIDLNDVYLYASSAEVGYLTALLGEQPSLWKGAILFHPGGFPDLNNVRVSALFVDEGDLDVAGAKGATRFQDECLRAGVRLSLVVHAGSSHIMQSRQPNRERAQQLAKFLLER